MTEFITWIILQNIQLQYNMFLMNENKKVFNCANISLKEAMELINKLHSPLLIGIHC